MRFCHYLAAVGENAERHHHGAPRDHYAIEHQHQQVESVEVRGNSSKLDATEKAA